jgi:hypothetical protein
MTRILILIFESQYMGLCDPPENMRQENQAPDWSIKIMQADGNKGFVSTHLAGLFNSDGCGFASIAGKRKKSVGTHKPIY